MHLLSVISVRKSVTNWLCQRVISVWLFFCQASCRRVNEAQLCNNTCQGEQQGAVWTTWSNVSNIFFVVWTTWRSVNNMKKCEQHEVVWTNFGGLRRKLQVVRKIFRVHLHMYACVPSAAELRVKQIKAKSRLWKTFWRDEGNDTQLALYPFEFYCYCGAFTGSSKSNKIQVSLQKIRDISHCQAFPISFILQRSAALEDLWPLCKEPRRQEDKEWAGQRKRCCFSLPKNLIWCGFTSTKHHNVKPWFLTASRRVFEWNQSPLLRNPDSPFASSWVKDFGWVDGSFLEWCYSRS